MTEPMDYYQVTEGYRFPEAGYRLAPALVAAYLDAVDDDANFRDGEQVPPLAVAALAMNSLSNSLTMPDGSIHTQQEVSCLAPASVGESIICRSWISRKKERGRFQMMTVETAVTREDGQPLLRGKTSFILPEQAAT